MYSHLQGLRVVEGSSFVAAPSCGLYLAQLGAEVIRFDQIGGGPDFRRWPKAESGASFYWEGLNKGKKSIAIDLRRPEGRELALQLATAPGHGAGVFVTNYPAAGFLAHAKLVERRADQITARVMGWADGGNGVDYTINSAVGVPQMTGPADSDEPVNHVLPAWDLLTGSLAALSVLAALRRREQTGRGEEIRVPLSDVAISSLANLGQVGEVLVGGADRPRVGNDIFGAYGRDFVTSDGRRVMVAAISARQWADLLSVLGIGEEIARMEEREGVSFSKDEGVRFEHRETLNALIGEAIAQRSYADLKRAFDASAVCWGPYQSLHEAVTGDPRLVSANPLFSSIAHPSGHDYPAPGFAPTMSGAVRSPPRPAPKLGENTEQILAEVLSYPAHEIARLHDDGIVASAAP